MADEKMPHVTVVPHVDNVDLAEVVEEKTPLVKEISEPEDFYDFGHHIQSNYDEVFLEPRHLQRSAVGRAIGPMMNKLARIIYDNTQAVFYYFFTVLLGIFLSVIWGIIFAVNNFYIVWLYQPSIKVTFLWLRMFSVLYKAAIRISLDPVFEACGNVFSRIKGSFTFNMKGLPERHQAITNF